MPTVGRVLAHNQRGAISLTICCQLNVEGKPFRRESPHILREQFASFWPGHFPTTIARLPNPEVHSASFCGAASWPGADAGGQPAPRLLAAGCHHGRQPVCPGLDASCCSQTAAGTGRHGSGRRDQAAGGWGQQDWIRSLGGGHGWPSLDRPARCQWYMHYCSCMPTLSPHDQPARPIKCCIRLLCATGGRQVPALPSAVRLAVGAAARGGRGGRRSGGSRQHRFQRAAATPASRLWRRRQ